MLLTSIYLIYVSAISYRFFYRSSICTQELEYMLPVNSMRIYPLLFILLCLKIEESSY